MSSGSWPEESTQELYELISKNPASKARGAPILAKAQREFSAATLTGAAANTRSAIDPYTLYQSNLELTSFIGREDELTQLGAMVRQHRLVTVCGVGGGGKTRLVLEACRTLPEHFSGGISVVTCEDAEPNILIGRLQTLAKDAQTSGSPSLFVLDSFDLSGLPYSYVLKLIGAAPCVSVVITSREPLELLGERPPYLAATPLPKRYGFGAAEHKSGSAAFLEPGAS